MAARPDMTAQWESTLTKISEKQCRYQDFMLPLVETLHTLIHQARQQPAAHAFRGLPAAEPNKKPRRKAAKAKETE